MVPKVDQTIHGRHSYPPRMFRFGKPSTAGQWISHIIGALVAVFLIGWLLRIYIL